MTVERISVVIPVYNERENIGACLAGLARALANVEHELLVCYDFDEDTTLEGIRAMGDSAPKSLRLVKNTLGRGPHKALMAGFQAASGDVVVTTMADLSDPPELIPAMAEKVRSGSAVVSGSRYMHGGSQKGGPLLKRTMSRVAGVSLAWVAGMGTHDATSNFRAYSTRFLRATTIEATAGFEIALELTVKAHLEGRGVGEVASSWADRAAGESRFQLWKWLPNYLRWYVRAMREPIAVWITWLVALLASAWSLPGPGNEFARVVAWSSAAVAAIALVFARSLRGRTRWSDALLPIIALAPPLLLESTFASCGLLGARGGAMVAIFAGTVPRERLRASLRGLASRVDQRALGVLLLVVLVWASHLAPVLPRAGAELDPSWQQSIGRALREELRFGEQLLFTYGPLGWFLESPHEHGLFWTKVLLFEIVFKLLVAALVVAAAMRISGLLERGLFLSAAIVPMGGNDAWAFLAIASASAWMLADPERPVLREAVVLALLAVLALVKFTFLAYASLAVLFFALHCLRTRGLHRALRTPSIFVALVVALWTGVGQSPLDLPAYVATSLAITGGYSAAMGQASDAAALSAAFTTLFIALAALVLALERPFGRSPANVLVLVLAAGGFLAFKAGFVRNAGNAVTHFAFFAAAPFLLAMFDRSSPSSAMGRIRRTAGIAARIGCFLLALQGYGIARGHAGTTFDRLFGEWGHETAKRSSAVLDPASHMSELVEANAAQDPRDLLPQITRHIGASTVDLVANTQGVLHANRFTWHPRPAFQSYVAYSPELLRRNAAFLAGADAPRYVLFQFETIDQRLPQLDDTLALQVLSRDWRPVLEEGGYILLERHPEARSLTAPPRAAERPAVLERHVRFGEWIELGDLEGSCHLMQAELRLTAQGRIANFALHTRSTWVEVEDSRERKARFRVVPPILAEGVFANPFLIANDEWMDWFMGEECARIVRLRFTPSEDEKDLEHFAEPFLVRVALADDLVPRPPTALERIERFPMLVTTPVRVTTRFPWYPAEVEAASVLVVHAPSDMVFKLRPGRWRLTGRFGLLDTAWQSGATDGVNFAVVVTDAEGKELPPIFKRLLDPVTNAVDRGPQDLELEFDSPRQGPLYLRTRPGPMANTNSDWAWWTKIELARIGDVAPR